MYSFGSVSGTVTSVLRFEYTHKGKLLRAAEVTTSRDRIKTQNTNINPKTRVFTDRLSHITMPDNVKSILDELVIIQLFSIS